MAKILVSDPDDTAQRMLDDLVRWSQSPTSKSAEARKAIQARHRQIQAQRTGKAQKRLEAKARRVSASALSDAASLEEVSASADSGG